MQNTIFFFSFFLNVQFLIYFYFVHDHFLFPFSFFIILKELPIVLIIIMICLQNDIPFDRKKMFSVLFFSPSDAVMNRLQMEHLEAILPKNRNFVLNSAGCWYLKMFLILNVMFVKIYLC